uniref:Cytochrome P450 2J6 n=1 Tax=Buteo japonicus TaxID=224669 RepID=A0A8C0BFA0_9AVES
INEIQMLVLDVMQCKIQKKKLPPGEIKLAAESLVLRKTTLAKTYGNIYTLWFGWAPVIILNGYQVVKDGVTTHPEDVSGRMVSPFFKAMAKGKGEIFLGCSWKQQRRFGIMTLRSLGMGKKGLEYRVQEEASHLVEFFVNLKVTVFAGRPVNPSFPLFHPISNVICALVFGYHFSDEDKTFHELISAMENLFRFAVSFVHQLYEIFPWLMCRLPGPHKKVLSCYDVLSSFARKKIRRHVERGIPDEPQDFIDFYLAEMEKPKYDEDNLVYVINDLFLGGSETSSTTLNWVLLCMVVNPDIQEKVQKELDAVLGPSQVICYEDWKKLPYTNAMVHEIQRFSNFVFVGMPRVCVRDTILLGFPIKKGTIIMPNITSVLYDPEQLETPQRFNPGHFLDKEGNFVPREAFLPFSAGKYIYCPSPLPSAGHRVCLGEHLARTELFIFFASLLWVLTFRLPEGVAKINTGPIFGGTLQPHPYRVCAIPC